MDKALDIWTNLNNYFSQGDRARISDLEMEIATLHQVDLTVMNYFTKLHVIWDEPDPTWF